VPNVVPEADRSGPVGALMGRGRDGPRPLACCSQIMDLEPESLASSIIAYRGELSPRSLAARLEGPLLRLVAA
jgi:hypothetical protein